MPGLAPGGDSNVMVPNTHNPAELRKLAKASKPGQHLVAALRYRRHRVGTRPAGPSDSDSSPRTCHGCQCLADMGHESETKLHLGRPFKKPLGYGPSRWATTGG
jgi:hypothetical protein